MARTRQLHRILLLFHLQSLFCESRPRRVGRSSLVLPRPNSHAHRSFLSYPWLQVFIFEFRVSHKFKLVPNFMAYGYSARNYRRRGRVARRGLPKRRLYPLVRYRRPATLTAPVRRIITNYAEKKFIDMPLVDNTITPAWEFWGSLFDAIPQGTSANTRIGNKIYVTKVNIRFTIRGQATMAVDGNLVRVVLFKDVAANGKAVTWHDLFHADALVSTRSSVFNSNVSLIKDITLGQHVTALAATSGTTSAAGAYYSAPRVVDWTVYPKMIVDYDSSTSGVASILKNNMGIGYVGLSATAAYISGYIKVEFTDC